MQEFVSAFHSLRGVTIGERRKNLHRLLSEAERSPPAPFDPSFLRPRTPLEECFKVEAVVRLGNGAHLLDLLTSRNPILVRKALRAGAAFAGRALEGVTGDQLVRDVFPRISLSAKEQLLGLLASHLRDPATADEYFGAVEGAYGLHLARRLLPACTDALILDRIRGSKVEVGPRQLLAIVRRYPGRARALFDALDSYEWKVKIGKKYVSVFRHLARHDPPAFLDLYRKYRPRFQLGRRSSARFVRENGERIVEDPTGLERYLRCAHLHRGLGRGDFLRLYEDVFPRSMNRLRFDLYVQLEMAGHLRTEGERAKLLLGTFRKLYGYEMWECSDLMATWFVERMAPEDRREWVSVAAARPAHVTEEQWISYMGTEESVPLLKGKIALTSNRKARAALVKGLALTCALNKDNRAFADVCAYIMDKHRNDHKTVHKEFLVTVWQHCDLPEFAGPQWAALLRVVRAFKVNCGTDTFVRDIEEKYVRHRLTRGLPVVDELRQWLRDYPDQLRVCGEVPEHEKRCLLTFNDLIDSGELEDRHVHHFLYALLSWNELHPRDPVSPFANARALRALKRILREERFPYSALEVAAHCARLDYERAEREGLVRLLFEHQEVDQYADAVLARLLRFRPEAVPDHVDLLLMARASRSTYRNYSHLAIPEAFAAAASAALGGAHGTSFAEKRATGDAAGVLSHALRPEQYLELLARHSPAESGAADLGTDRGRAAHGVQRALLSAVPSLTELPTAAADCVLGFGGGDHPRLVCRALHHLARRMTEEEAVAFLRALADRPDFVRKYSVAIAFQVLSVGRALDLFAAFVRGEGRPAVRASAFRAASRCFRRNPNERLWELIRAEVAGRGRLDLLAFGKGEVPRAYLGRYVSLVSEALRQRPRGEGGAAAAAAEEAELRLLEAATVPEVPEGFARRVIREELARCARRSVDFGKAVRKFVRNAIVHEGSEGGRRGLIESVLAVLKGAVGPRDEATAHVFVREFCSDLVTNRDAGAKGVLEMFTGLWAETFSKQDRFDEYLHLKFAAIYLGAVEGKLSISDVAAEVGAACDGFYGDGSCATVPVFYAQLQLFLGHFLMLDVEEDCTENRLIFVEGVLKGGRTVASAVLGVHLLPDCLDSVVLRTRCEGIVLGIADRASPAVSVYLNNFLIKHVGLVL